jgi:signal transduction histidine kinase
MQKFTDNISFLIFTGIAGMLMLAISFILVHVRSQNILLKQRDITQKVQLNHQQELLQATIHSQEKERQRIGQDLHDDVGTALSNLRLLVDSIDAKFDTDHHKFSVKSKQMIDKVIGDVRHISHDLSPPGIELYGFLGALNDLCEEITTAGTHQINIHNQAGQALESFNKIEVVSIYRIMKELLNNTIKHADATLINIWFIQDLQEINVIYEDNGRGMGTEINTGKGMGIFNIESRLKVIGATEIHLDLDFRGYRFQFTQQKIESFFAIIYLP